MTDTASPAVNAASDAAASTGGKKSAAATKKAAAAKRARAKPTRPPTSEMVCTAIKSLKERSGSSLHAIKKFIAANYKVDAEKISPFIRKYIKAGVAAGTLVQIKGKGASGSFKMAATNASKAGEDNAGYPATKPLAKAKTAAKRQKSPKKVAVAAAAIKKPRSVVKKAKASPKKIVVEKKGGKLAKSPAKLKRKASPAKKAKSPKAKKTTKAIASAAKPRKALAKKK